MRLLVLFILLAVIAFYAVLFGVAGLTCVLAIAGWTTFALRGRGRRFRGLNLGLNIAFSLVALIGLGLSVTWFGWFGGNVALAGLQTAMQH